MTGDTKRRTIRDGSAADGAACAAIYEPYVTGTAVTFETQPPRAEQMAQRIAEALDTHAWVVLEEDGRVCGYAYGARFKDRAAYRWSCEVSVYVELGRRRTGAGRQLYAALFDRLAARGFRIAVAGMTVPNEGSVGFHRAMGFAPAGTFRNIGYKFDGWHDVFWAQRPLATGNGSPPELT